MNGVSAMWEIRVPAALASLKRVAELVRSLGHKERLPAERCHRLRLATDEIVTNIIVHGYRRRGGDISVCGGADHDTVWVSVEDEAPPFDPIERIAAAELSDGWAARGTPGGLGLLLVARSLDDLRYEFVDGHNRTTLAVRRTPPEAW